MMNSDLKKDWVEALRSGEFKQTRAMLKRSVATETCPIGYCCLGVLVHVLLTKHPDLIPEGIRIMEGNDAIIVRGSRDESATWLCGGLEEALGLYDGPVGKLINMNDGVDEAPKDFNTIADYIERNL